MARGLLNTGYGSATPVADGLLARFTAGVRSEISTGVNGWMGPGTPIPPVAPSGTQPRRWDYRFGQNIDYQPKIAEGCCYSLLRDLAEGYDLVRMVIETRKDQVARVPWSFQLRPLPDEPPSKTKERQLGDKRIPMLDQFFKKPDAEHSYSDWQRMILEDMFVCDAPAVLPRWRRDGGIFCFDVIDGTTISLLIDEDGRGPMPPDPCYRQIIKGMPAVFMMMPCPQLPKTDQLFFFPRNCRTNRLYGFSPVEQIMLTVNIGLRREIFQLQYYTDGTIPDVFIEAPEGLSEDRLQQFETMWNEKFATTAARRKANMIPYGTKVTFAKDQVLKDEMDEYLARKVAYAFSVSPTALVKMVNRAAGAQMSEDAKAEGLEPILYWYKEFIDQLLDFMGCGDIEHEWGQYTRENPLQQAQIDQIYLSTVDDQGHSVYRANEVREKQGLDQIDFAKEDEEQHQIDLDNQQDQIDLQNKNAPDESEQDQQLRQEQTNRADTSRPKALKSKKKDLASRRATLQNALTKRLLAPPAY
jgi:hypothetical protein